MTLTDILIAYEGVKERAKLHAMTSVDLQLLQWSEQELAKSRSGGGATPLKDALKTSILFPLMPKHEQVAVLHGKTNDKQPLPNLSGAAARGILLALEQGLLDKAWKSFGRFYQEIELTARKE